MTTDAAMLETKTRRYPLLLALAALCAYWNSFGGTYFLDDSAWITKNPRIGDAGSFFLGRRVLISESLTLNYWLDGVNPRGYHVLNIAVHILAGLALFGVVRRTLMLPRWDKRVKRRADVLAFVTALIWLVHPLNTQAVTYLIQRCESMMGLFYFLTLYCMVRGATTAPARRWYLLSCLSCCAGALCKEVILTAPLVILLFDWTFLSPSIRALWRVRWRYYVALTAPLVLFAALMTMAGGLTEKGASLGFGYLSFGPLQYALTETGVILYYLRLSVYPWPLCLDYVDWPIARSLADCWPCALAIGLMLIAVIVLTIRRHWLGFLGAWFFVILAPSSSILPIQDPAFEHRMYLPLAAVVVLAIVTLSLLLDRAGARLACPLLGRRVGIGLVLAVTLLFSILTMMRNAQYCNFTSMAKDIVAKRPANYRARDTLAQVDYLQDHIEEARRNLRAAMLAKPGYFTLYNTAGNCLVRLGRLDEAVEMYQRAVDLNPNYESDVYVASLGRALLLRGDTARALGHLTDAIHGDPANARYHVLRGWALDQLGRGADADGEYATALRLDPSMPHTLTSDARALMFHPETNAVMLREAVLLAEAGRRMTRDRDADNLDTLAEAYAAVGRFDDAQDVGGMAVTCAMIGGQVEAAEQMRRRLRLYQEHRVYNQANAS